MKSVVIKTALGFVLVLVVATAGLYFLLHNGALTGQEISSGQPVNPSVIGTFAGFSAGSATISLDDGTQKIFSVSTSTQVVSQVKSDEVGKTLDEIAQGTLVMVQPHAPNSTVADRISILPEPSVTDTDPAGPPIVLSGTVVSTTTTSVTINTTADPSLRINLTKNTSILSNVLAGAKGKTLADISVGNVVTVAGLASANGLVVRSILILSVIQ